MFLDNSPENIIQAALAGFSFAAVIWSLYVLIETWRSAPLKSTLSEERRWTREAVKYTIWVTVAMTFKLIDSTISAFLRNSYTLPVLTDQAPAWVLAIVLQNYGVDYLVSVLPSVFLLLLVNGLKEYDARVATGARLEARRKIVQRQRGAGGRGD